jgi:uncharacterized membrane protein (UPF0127 family)
MRFCAQSALSPAARGERSRGPIPWGVVLAPRLRDLPVMTVLGLTVAVATGPRSRLLGLARLDRREAGAGLLIPRCSSVHTFGMRFALDLIFLDGDGRPVAFRRAVPPRRLAGDRRAAAVLELPTAGPARRLPA